MPRMHRLPRPLSFSHLYSDEEFCGELGRVMLAAGMLETELRSYLATSVSVRNADRCSLGGLVRTTKGHGLLQDLHASLDLLVKQRNSLAHRVHSILSGVLYDELLPESDHIDSDVSLFTERAWQLARNLRSVAELVAKRRALPEESPRKGNRGMTPNQRMQRTHSRVTSRAGRAHGPRHAARR